MIDFDRLIKIDEQKKLNFAHENIPPELKSGKSLTFKEAIHYFKEASNLNNSEAKNNLGIIYKIGKGVSPNLANSIDYFEEAIRLNYVTAMFNLAHIYFYNEAGISDDKKAMKLLIKSSRYIDSLILLCLMIMKIYPNSSIGKIQEKIEALDKEFAETFIYFFENFKANVEKELISYDNLYNEYKDINLVFYENHVENFTLKKKIIVEDKRIDINSDFYEGFGDI